MYGMYGMYGCVWYMVCMVCWSTSYVVKFYYSHAAEHGKHMDRWKTGVSNAE